MGLLEQAKAKWQGLLDYIDANTPRHAGALPTVGRVVDQGLINPNRFNKPSADRFKESTFGLLGIVPGVGDYASVVESADLFNRGEKFAGTMAALGALPLVPAIGGMFIGKGAKTWDALKAQQADELLKQGIDPREVWKQTGTMRGVDGALRQEIPDNLADIEKSHPMAWLSEMSPLGKDIPLEQAQSMGKQYNDMVDKVNMFRSADGTMDSMLLHRDLYNAYPDLRTTRLSFDNMGSAYGGSFDEAANKVSLARGNLGNATEGKSTTLHELQHAIQQREGWARGGSPENSWAAVSDLEDALNSKKETLWAMMRKEIPGDKATQQALRDEIHSMHANYETVASDPMEAYRRLAGEAEARLTQARMNMNMDERLASYPYDMLDVPQDQLIVRGLLDGPAMHTVYHGSPHKFDKFDMSKIGTGEGAQAYGHGLYFAESPGVAESYQRALSDATVDGKVADWSNANDVAAGWFDAFKDRTKAADYLRGQLKNTKVHSADDLQTFKQAIDVLESGKPIGEMKPGGQLYKVDIPDEAIPRMLDWDKPLSEQAPEFQDLLRKADLIDESVWPHYTGQQLYEGEMNARGPWKQNGFADNAAAPPISELLKAQGIPGIRYLDGNSRGAGQGTSNFVLFDDQLPRILEVNGQPTGLLSYADEAAKKKRK